MFKYKYYKAYETIEPVFGVAGVPGVAGPDVSSSVHDKNTHEGCDCAPPTKIPLPAVPSLATLHLLVLTEVVVDHEVPL